MSLIDYTTNQSFTVQNVGDSSWSSTGMAVTGTGTDSNGTTAAVVIYCRKNWRRWGGDDDDDDEE
ncbi:MAG: hypothetical protein LUF34_02985 [Lachnospiraceae bacterium]|nr:hypothetical protein [Lachnospiraceae bacterium]